MASLSRHLAGYNLSLVAGDASCGLAATMLGSLAEFKNFPLSRLERSISATLTSPGMSCGVFFDTVLNCSVGSNMPSGDFRISLSAWFEKCCSLKSEADKTIYADLGRDVSLKYPESCLPLLDLRSTGKSALGVWYMTFGGVSG